MRYFFFILLFFPFCSPHAAQPISVSLAECSVIYNVTSITAEAKGKSVEQVSTMREMSDVFRNASYSSAEDEGQVNGQAYIHEELPALEQKWDERWLNEDDMKALSYMKENMEWVSYCGKLGKDRGLLPLKP